LEAVAASPARPSSEDSSETVDFDEKESVD
jgi:hypothetical protein